MGIYFRDGWEADNTCSRPPAQETLRQHLQYALGKITDRAPQAFRDLKNIGESASALAKIYISKGLHQEEGGSAVLPEHHITIETPDYPNPKRFHLYFLLFKNGWFPSKFTHIEARRVESLPV